MVLNGSRSHFYRWLGVLTTILLFSVCGGAKVAGQSTEFPGYLFGLQVLNLSDQVNTCTLAAYDEAGNQIGITIVDSLSPLAPQTWGPLPNLPEDNRSVVVTCQYPYAMITNVLSSDFGAAGSYVVPTTGATEVYLPLLNKENSGYTTWYTVQNLGLEEATVEVTYSDGTTIAPLVIPPLAARNVFQSSESHAQAIFAATLASDQPIRAAVLQEGDGIIFAHTGVALAGGGTIPPPEGIQGSTGVNAGTASSETLIFPLVNANNAGYVTGIQILNGGDEATSVTVSYTPSDAGSACTETRSIAAGTSRTFALAAFTSGTSASDCLAGRRFIGSAVVTDNSTGQPLTGIVNQLLPGQNGEAYVAFAPEEATNSLVMPLIMDRNGGYFTGFSVQHVGGPESVVTCVFSNSTYTVSATLGEGEALVDLQQGRINDGYVGSGVCTAVNDDTKIVAVVNELQLGGTGDQFLVYEGIPLP